MLKKYIMWALLCATAPIMCAQKAATDDSICSDSTEYSIPPQLLNEVVVTATPVINKTDRKVIRPQKETLDSTSDGIDILRKLQLSRITINPLTREITMTGGGSVVLCINGVESTSAQISAIRPDDILRIEYHDAPGVRYAGAAAVIDYITSRHDYGGNLTLDTFGAFASGRYASIDNLAGQYNYGNSVWSINVGYMGQRKNKWIRDYEETWYYPDVTVTRNETGSPVTVGASGMESIVNYNYMHPRGNMFNLRLGFDFSDVPNKEEGDRHTILETSLSDTPIIVKEHTEEYSVRPNIGLYYLHQLAEGQNIAFDLQSSYMRSRMMHQYSENQIGEISRVNGSKYTMKFLGMYEHRTGSKIWNVGISNNSSIIHNIYLQNEPIKIDVTQTQMALVGEYSNKLGNWGTILNLRATYNNLKQKNQAINKFVLLPSVNVSFRPNSRYFLRYTVSIDHIMPKASEISAIAQPVQRGMILRGNPALKPFCVIDQAFTSSFWSRYASVEARIEYHKEHNPIMGSVIFENEEFVKTYLNQRSFQRLRAGVSLSLRPWKEHLSITAEPMLTRYFSHGINYHHCHNIFRTGWSVDFSYGKWLAYANIMSGPENKMYGEKIIEEKDMNQIMVGYKRNVWSIHFGIFNAFLRNYWMETRNMSALTPYKSKAHSGRNSSYIAIKFNLSLDSGRKGRQIDIPENGHDNDSGILTGTK